MLAPKSKTALAVLVALITIGINQSHAQQPPSQRYQPLTQPTYGQQQREQATTNPYRTDPRQMDGRSASQNRNIAPPSVHVPPQNARQLSAPSYTAPTTSPANVPASYNFSDSPASQFGPPANPSQFDEAEYARQERGMIRQTSYVEDGANNNEPVVPEILAAPTSQTGAPKFQAPRQTSAATIPAATNKALTPPMIAEDTVPTKTGGNSIDQYSNQMQQMQNRAPRIAPQDFSGSNQIRQEFDSLQKQIADRKQSPPDPAKTLPTLPPAQKTAAAPEVAPKKPAATPTTKRSAVPEIDSSESASEFISRLNPVRNDNSFADQRVQQAGGTTELRNASPATMHVPAESASTRDQYVQTASAQSDPITNASIKLTTPSLTVETFGPQTVGINKPATYKVVVTNAGNISAEQILIGINMPAWIDIENVNLTAGEKEITDGKQQARLLWKVDHLPGNGTQTITITAVPRKAQTFDLGIEWTLAARKGSANIQVTQPKLDMSIVGPDEVQYGEQALYHVTVRNPGTGTAENVVVMLPEALGGERASLGNIAPGKDKNFQVELLARTAGQLDLIANAVADGNLEIAASRKLTVRRANLGITIQGPSLKYAGGIGEYVVTINNAGDATANEIIAAMALPTGVQFLGGIESFKLIDGGLRWQVGSLDPGQKREYKVSCQLDSSGDLQLEVGAQGKGDLQCASACITKVETVADLVLTVQDPKGPLPTGQSTLYEISIRNRGSRAAKGVNVVMQFSEGIEPKSAIGLEHRLVPGQVLFAPIAQIDPGQEIRFKIDAEAFKPGTHVFRAQLICEESDSREIAEGTTKFFGDEIRTTQQNTANQKSKIGGSQDFDGIQR